MAMNVNKVIKDYLLIIIGTTMLAFSISVFFDPLGMVIGGVSGIAIILKELTAHVIEGGIPIWITNLVLNVPLFLIALVIKGKNFGARSLFATFYLSFALFFTEKIPPITEDMLLGCIFGSVVAGIGMGLVFSAYATTGGTDLAAAIVQNFIKHLSIARIMLFMDGLIIAGGYFVFGAEKTMYALIAVFLITKVIDTILEGMKFAKAAFIITDQEEEVSKNLLVQLDRGLTGLYGEGMYTGTTKTILLCVVAPRQIYQVKEIVKSVDPKAFVIVADVREVLGEGFIE